MSDNRPLINFEWIEEGMLAVGDEPSSEEKMNWLFTQGFRDFLSLGKPSDIVEDLIHKAGTDYVLYNMSLKYKNNPKSSTMEMIASCFFHQAPIYIFCSAKIEFAFSLAKRFIKEKDLHISRKLAQLANDLNHGDGWDWRRGHHFFQGHTIYQAINALIVAMSNTDPETRFIAADTLVEFMEHADHGCFPKSAVQALSNVRAEVEEIVLNQNPEYQAEYERILRHYDDNFNKNKI